MLCTEKTFTKCEGALANGELQAVLFFEENFGLASILADRLERQFQPEEKIILDYQDIEKDFKARLYSLLGNDFFSTRKVIKIFNAKGKDLKANFQFLTEERFTDKLIIIFGNEIDGKNALKTLFEKCDFTASVSCYQDDEVTAREFITAFCNQNNLRMDADAVQCVASFLHGDRALLLHELEKIQILYGDKEDITVSDVENIIENEQSFDAGALADFILLGDKRKAVQMFDMAKTEISAGEEAISIIEIVRTFLYIISDIVDRRQIIESGGTLEQAMKVRFVFFKRVPIVSRILTINTVQKLNILIKAAMQTEKIAKIYGDAIAKSYFEKHLIMR